MDKEQLQQMLLDISETEDPVLLKDIAEMMQEKTDKSRRERIKEHKRDGLTPLESLQEFKKNIAWAGSQAMGLTAKIDSELDAYIEQEARETFRRAKKDVEEIYGVTLKKKRRRK